MSTLWNRHDDITLARRLFLARLITAAAASQLGMTGSVHGQPRTGNRSFGPLKQVDAGLLSVGYAEAGPPEGPVVILLHGWPYDIHSFVDVAPLLGSAGYRVIVPHLRGYGTTRFLSSETFRNGQPSALAMDIVALMDALEIRQAILAGFDWGARTSEIVATLWPERCKGLVAVSGYLIGNQEAGRTPLPPKAELQWWYQFYFATERGRAGYERYRDDFARLIWQLASPKWDFDDETFARSAASFANPDHVSIVIHNYRWRLGLAEAPVITVPTVTLACRKKRRRRLPTPFSRWPAVTPPERGDSCSCPIEPGCWYAQSFRSCCRPGPPPAARRRRRRSRTSCWCTAPSRMARAGRR